MSSDKKECKRILLVSANANSGHWWQFPNGKQGEGYNPFHQLGGSDDLYIRICLDCGKLQNMDLKKLNEEVEKQMK